MCVCVCVCVCVYIYIYIYILDERQSSKGLSDLKKITNSME